MKHDEQVSQLLNDLELHIRVCTNVQRLNSRFAFWHDVGVTGLSALSTVLVGVAEMSPFGAHGLRVVVLFLTGSITVFSACDHFFKFKANAETHRGVAARLVRLKRTLSRSKDGLAPERLAQMEDELDSAIAPIELAGDDPAATVWGSKTTRNYAIAGLLFLLSTIIGVSLFLVRSRDQPEALPQQQGGSVKNADSNHPAE